MSRLAARLCLPALLALAGCAALPWPGATLPSSLGRRTLEGHLDLRGVTHVHTQASFDSRGTIAEVVAAARASRIDWVAFTEHRRSASVPATGLPSHVSGVTLIPGWEVSAAGGSILVIGAAECPPRPATAREVIAWAHAREAVAFASHIERSRLLADAAAFAELDGVELVNLHAQLLARPLSFSLATLVLPRPSALRLLLHVPNSNLEKWEGTRAVPGVVGGVDAHAKIRILGRTGTLDRYQDLFRVLTTHVHSVDREADSIVRALADGRSYIAFEGLAPVEWFQFTPESGGVRTGGARVADYTLICDGSIAATASGSEVVLPAPEGARRCRVEARLGGRLWIATAYRTLPR